MDSQLTVRLPDDLRDALDAAARRARRRPSEIVRLALRMYLDVEGAGTASPADRVSDLLGSLASGTPDLADHHREYVLEAIRRGR